MDNLNFELYEKFNLNDGDLIYLFAAKQINKQKLEIIPNDVLSRLQEASLLKSITGTKKENPLHKNKQKICTPKDNNARIGKFS